MKLKFFTFLAIISLISGCSLHNDEPYCFYQSAVACTNVTGPETTTVDTPIDFQVTFQKANTCGTFNRFNYTSGYPKDILPILDFEGCSCQESTLTDTQPYTFSANAAGTYELRFYTGDGVDPIVKTVIVTAE